MYTIKIKQLTTATVENQQYITFANYDIIVEVENKISSMNRIAQFVDVMNPDMTISSTFIAFPELKEEHIINWILQKYKAEIENFVFGMIEELKNPPPLISERLIEKFPWEI